MQGPAFLHGSRGAPSNSRINTRSATSPSGAPHYLPWADTQEGWHRLRPLGVSPGIPGRVPPLRLPLSHRAVESPPALSEAKGCCAVESCWGEPASPAQAPRRVTPDVPVLSSPTPLPHLGSALEGLGSQDPPQLDAGRAPQWGLHLSMCCGQVVTSG